MGAFNGSLTYKQYLIKDPLPEGWQDAFQAKIAKHACDPITADHEEDRTVGWCNPAFLLDTELVPETWHFNEYIVLSMRIDTLKVPGPLLKLYTERQARRMKDERGKELNRYEKAEIKEQVNKELRRKAFPSFKAIDMVWHLDQGIVRFWSGSEKVNMEFVELFEETFDLTPIPEAPYTLAAFRMDYSEADLSKLADLEPSLFTEVGR